jgi:uncharacterized protein YaaN involved in tellurite resistance
MGTEQGEADGSAFPVPAEPGAVAEIRRGIDLADRAGIAGFGDKAQRDVAAFADRVLAQTRNGEMGDTGRLLLDVIERARGLDPAELGKRGLLQRLFGSAEAQLRRFVGRFEDVSAQIERIVIDLERHRDGLRRDISLLDELYEETRRSIRFLEAHIEAGRSFAAEYEGGELARLKGRAEAGGGDVMAAQEYSDARQALDRLEKRVFYLSQARQVGIQQLPQIRIVQSGDETLIENLQATTELAIPVWKQKMVLLLGLNRQGRALEMQRAVTDATGEMMRQAAAMMKTQAVEIERQAQRGIVDMAALEKANRDLIDTVNGVVDVQRAGRAKRAEAERLMDRLTDDLRTALTRVPA